MSVTLRGHELDAAARAYDLVRVTGETDYSLQLRVGYAMKEPRRSGSSAIDATSRSLPVRCPYDGLDCEGHCGACHASLKGGRCVREDCRLTQSDFGASARALADMAGGG